MSEMTPSSIFVRNQQDGVTWRYRGYIVTEEITSPTFRFWILQYRLSKHVCTRSVTILYKADILVGLPSHI